MTKRRILSALLVLSMLLSALPMTARAAVVESDWVPEGEAPAGAEIVEERWVDTVTKYYLSPDSAHAGEDTKILDAVWVYEDGSTEPEYWASFPKGFERNYSPPDQSDIYFMEWRTSPRQSEERETERIVVTNKWAGYVYWHWMYDCGGARGHAKRAILNKKGNGAYPKSGPYYYKYFGAFVSTRGNYSGSNDYCQNTGIYNYIVPERTGWEYCQGATRWFRFDYYQCTWVRERKEYWISTVTKQIYTDPAEAPANGKTLDTDKPARMQYDYSIHSVQRQVRYRYEIEDVCAPRADKPSGSRLEPGELITLQCDTPGATIYYVMSRDGLGEEQVYTGPFPAADLEEFQLSAYAVKEGMGDSAGAFYRYYIGDLKDRPKVATLPPEEVTETEAVLCASVESDSEILELSFTYYERGDTRPRTVIADKDGRFRLTDLLPGTEYRYLAGAVNLEGASLGNICAFTTAGRKLVAPRSVTVSPAFAAVEIGATRTLVPVFYPSTANSAVLWESADPAVATVDANGVVTGVGTGLTRITATCTKGRTSGECVVEVFPAGADVTGAYDFSEMNMVMSCSKSNTATGYDSDYAAGGSCQRAAAYLTRWSGVVAEANDPYDPSTASYTEREADFHLQEILYIPWRTDPLDNDGIKSAIVNYGAVYSAMQIDAVYSAYNWTNLYLPEGKNGIPHCIAIVGWDDSFPRDRFRDGSSGAVPPGDGAFICKSSWGEDICDKGYYYVSYYDWSLGTSLSGEPNAVFYYLQSNTNYDRIYQYDELGAVDKYKGYTSDVGWYANVFPRQGETLAAPEVLKAVSFYTVQPETVYELYVVTDYKGAASLSTPGKPLKSGMIDYAGYHTIALDGIPLEAGTRFAVVVKIVATEGNASVFIEAPRLRISSHARAGAGESFVRDASGSWTDLTTLEENANVCLKAFTQTDENGLDLMGVLPPEESEPYDEETLAALSGNLNPAFLAWAESAELQAEGPVPGMGNCGLIPSSTLPELDVETRFSCGEQLPAVYDLRADGMVTPVRNQVPISACWAFAALASLESCALRAARSGYPLAGGMSQSGEEDVSLLLDSAGDTMTVPAGETLQLRATVYPFGSEAALVWSSSDESVCVVSTGGVVTAKAPGEAEIWVSTEDGQARTGCSVTVAAPAAAAEAVVFCRKSILQVGEQTLAELKLFPLGSAGSGVLWESEDPAVASVDEDGLITALGGGSTRITAYVEGGVTASALVSVDDGTGVFLAVNSNELVADGSVLRGSLMLKARAEEACAAQAVLAVYDAGGRMLGTAVLPLELPAGESAWDFSELALAAPGAEKVKVYLLRASDGGPLSLPVFCHPGQPG